MLDDIARNTSVVSHAIVDFSVFYFGLNGLFYRGVRESLEKLNKMIETHYRESLTCER